jgi:DNA topoisomerase-1
MPLIIVESPTKSKTIASFLGPEYKILASYGHVRDLPKGELGIDLENNFELKYVLPTKAKKNVNLLKKESAKSDLVILATDEDREGEAIAFHLAYLLGLKDDQSYQRIVFHEITKEAIQAALKNPRQIDSNLVNAQQARRVLDRIVGYKLSPFLWKKVARGLSAGRVQSVAVKLVCQREKEITDFQAQEYWTVQVLLEKDKIEFTALLNKKNNQTVDKLEIKTKEEADKITKELQGADYLVDNLEKKENKRNPLPPFTTSTLQQAAWHSCHFPARLTMSLAQRLYEKGLVSYHRTDSLNLSETSLAVAQKFILKNYGEKYWAGYFKRYKTKSKRAQEAHEAIRPAYPEKKPAELKLDPRQAKLYDLIWRRFMACQISKPIIIISGLPVKN